MRKVSNAFLNGVEISAQEAAYGILAMPLTKSSRDCVFISTGPPDERIVFMKTIQELQNLEPDSTDIAAKGLLDHYSHRPVELESLTLAEFASEYTYSKKRPNTKEVKENDDSDIEEELSGCEAECKVFSLDDGSGFVKKRNFGRIIRYRRYGEVDNPENFYRESIMLYLPWRNERSDILDKDISKLYIQNQSQIHSLRLKFNALEIDHLEKMAEDVEIEDSDNENDIDENYAALDDFQDQADIFNELFMEKNENVVEKIPMTTLLCDEEYNTLISTLNHKQAQYVCHVASLLTSGERFLEFVYGGAGDLYRIFVNHCIFIHN